MYSPIVAVLDWTIRAVFFTSSVGLHAPAVERQATAVRVPRGVAPTVDGRISPDEWNASFEGDVAAGVQLKLRHDGRFLYVAVRSAKPGFPSVCVVKGDTTRILHSSAALGAAKYVGRSGGDSRLATPFSFAMRAAETGATRIASQRAYVDEHGWVASNSAMSETDREMQIDLALLNGDQPRFAVGFYVEPSDSVVRWPATASDGCVATKVVQGFLPPTLKIEPERWALLRLE